MTALTHDIRIALRRLRRSPMFTTAATLTLAIAIGATTSVFSVVDAVLFKAMPFRAPDRVLTIWEGSSKRHVPRFSVSPMNYVDYEAQNHSFAMLAAFQGGRVTVTGTSEPERVFSTMVTPSYFGVLGIMPALGRALASDSGVTQEVVIGYGYWQRRFAGLTSVLGQQLLLDNRPYTIVGVMPRGIPGTAELWTRLSFAPTDLIHRDWHYIGAFGRLKPGVTPEAGTRELQAIAARLAIQYPETDEDWSVVTVPLLDAFVGPVRPALIMLLAAAACVLLIGVANLANLFLVRFVVRERDLAVRTALGATRGRLLREPIIEAAILGAGASAIGIGMAVAGVRVLRELAPATLPRVESIGMDGRVLGFAILVSIATVVVFGVLPAWHASRGAPADAMRESARGTTSASRQRLQALLVVLQVSLAFVLLTGAGLLVETFVHFQRTELGFDPRGVLTADVSLSSQRYATPAQTNSFASSVIARLAALPGVDAAAVSSSLPESSGWREAFTIIGDPPINQAFAPDAHPVFVSPGYFRTMGITLKRGRGVAATDDERAVKVAVIDEAMARRMFRDRDPIGLRLALLGPDVDTVQVVGIVSTVKQGGLIAEDVPWFYLSLAQAPSAGEFQDVVVRTSGDPETLAPVAKRTLFSLDPTVPLSNVKTMSTRIAQSVGTTRFSTFLASLFATVALILAIVGIYSVLAYIVVQRQREIAIRLALGASRAHVMESVIRRALVLAAVGIAIGAAASWWLARALAGLFEGVGPHDPFVFVGTAAVFVAVALAAAAVPAFRTTRINPASVLGST